MAFLRYILFLRQFVKLERRLWLSKTIIAGKPDKDRPILYKRLRNTLTYLLTYYSDENVQQGLKFLAIRFMQIFVVFLWKGGVRRQSCVNTSAGHSRSLIVLAVCN